MKNFIFVLLVFFVSYMPAKAQQSYPHWAGKGLIPVAQVKVSSTVKVENIIDLISPEGPILPNQLICKADRLADGGLVFNKVAFSVWYRDQAWVSKDAQCWDAIKRPDITSFWLVAKGYRPIGSGTEVHTDLQYSGLLPATYSQNKWCRANSATFWVESGPGNWEIKRFEKVIFSWRELNFFSLVSRDIKCTSSSREYNSWLRNRYWSYIGFFR